MAYGRFKPRGYGRKVGARRIGAPRRRFYGRRGARGRIQRSMNPSPTFVETYKANYTVDCPTGGGVGQVFKVKITDIPQVVDYANLYTQYRINWVKVTMIPQTNNSSVDINTAAMTQQTVLPWQGLARIAWSVQDSPNVTTPLNEEEVLKDNGSKIRPFKSMWSCSFKPVPDVSQTISGVVGANPIPTKSRFKQWFNFTSGADNNPAHGAVQTYITLPGEIPTGSPSMVPTEIQRFHVYFKVSFSLRDPK